MKSASILNRREFLRRATLATGALGVAPLVITGAAASLPPSGRITVGAIGIRGRGHGLLNVFLQQPDVQVVAVCDVIGNHRRRAKATVDNHYGNEDCTAYIDMRELLARPDIDAVLIATGDNNHAWCSVLAAQAGKDIFCEKPMGVTAAEGRAVMDAVRRFGRVYQCGTQRRNLEHFVFAVDLARSGRLGEIETVYAERAYTSSGVHFKVYEPEPEPAYEEVAWDLWLGPAAWRPYSRRYTQRAGWREHGDFSGGSITEWGSHTVDLCQWALDADNTAPISYEPIENGDVEAKYANGVKLVITKGLRMGTCPIRIEGTEGWVGTGDSGEIETNPPSLAAGRRWAPTVGRSGGHLREFLDCVKSRRQPRSSASASHYSMLACHGANISVRLNRRVDFDPVKEVFPGDDEATRLLSRTYREPYSI